MAEYDQPCADPDCGHARRLHAHNLAAGDITDAIHGGTCAASGCHCQAFRHEAPENASPTHSNASPDVPADSGEAQAVPAPAAAKANADREYSRGYALGYRDGRRRYCLEFLALTEEQRRLCELIGQAIAIMEGRVRASRAWYERAVQEVNG